MKEYTQPSIIICSSTEGLPVAQQVKDELSGYKNVQLWNEGVFKMNRSYLESLNRTADLFDFAILCLTPDDLRLTRGEEHVSPRDNLLFELGLFMGRMGRQNSFVVCHKSIQLLSDFDGITVGLYDQTDELVGIVQNISLGIKDLMKLSRLDFLPSTSMAIGYYENFLKKAYEALLDEKDVNVDGEPLQYSNFELRVLIPQKLSDLEPLRLKSLTRKYKKAAIESSPRSIGLYCIEENDKLILIDFPTTLLSSSKAIDMILKEDSIQSSQERCLLERKEIANFFKTLFTLTESLEEISIQEI